MKVILASSSPERAKLLEDAGFQYEVVPTHMDETLVTGKRLPPAEVARALAAQKAVAVFQKYPSSVILGADTIVCVRGEIFGCPKNRTEAVRMLSTLSQNNPHEVYTGVHLVSDYIEISFAERTIVEFASLTDAEINRYLDLYEEDAMRHPGAYNAVNGATGLIERINGSLANCMGLPVGTLVRRLRESGVRI